LAITRAIEDLWQVAKPGAVLMIAPFSGSEEGMGAMNGPRANPRILEELEQFVPQAKFRTVSSHMIGPSNMVILEVIK